MAPRTRQQPMPPADLFDYLDKRPIAPRPAAPADVAITVTDDWPAVVPVSDREARVIEAYFADVLDELFGPIP